MHIVRNGNAMSMPVDVTSDGRIGVSPKSLDNYIGIDTLHYSFAQAIPGGFHEAWETVTDYTSQLRFLFSADL